MRKFSEYLAEQDVPQNPGMLPDEEGAEQQELGQEEPEESSEFDVRNMPRNPGEKRLSGRILKYVSWLTDPRTNPTSGLSIGTKKSILHAVIAWLDISDVSTLNRLERPERSALIRQHAHR